MNEPTVGGTVFDLSASAAMMASPWWVPVLWDVNLVFSTVMVICGAIVGVYKVYHLLKGVK